MGPDRIYHIASFDIWTAAQGDGEYRPESLADEGFIHCSTAEQVIAVADALYRGQEGLVLLAIDPGRVPAEVRYEDCYGAGQAFPHLYGPLPVGAVTAVYELRPGGDGRFEMPEEVG